MNPPLPVATNATTPFALRAVLAGHVQGFGVRPAIHRLATELCLTGSVRNTARGVEVEIEGKRQRVRAFRRQLPKRLPAGAQPTSITWESIATRHGAVFTIESEAPSGPLTAAVPPDMAMCNNCRREVTSSEDRRHGYALTCCAACGPRYSIIRSMPYERDDTTMAAFRLCEACRHEYTDPSNRRFHAQTTTCPDCGPRVWCADSESRLLGAADEAVRIVAAALRRGRIVALAGIGGYQLLVDATDDEAIRRLRRLKARPARPFAVLVASVSQANKLAVLDAAERATLADRANPIVLVKSHRKSALAASVHPGLSTVGLMLPTTPLHALLADAVGLPLVCTSGNHEGEPLAWRTDDAQQRLAGLCDMFLHHDRPIERPIDDSVVRVVRGRPMTLRLARGLAPLSIEMPCQRPALALGGYQKTAAAWSNGQQAVLGPHVGDQQLLATRERFLLQCRDWQSLYRFTPELIVHDLHPDYFSTRWAATQPQPNHAVQHHYAHIVAGMLEAGWLDRTVLGIAWDGTGYGTDGTIWGGEFLIASAKGFQRFAHLRPFRLPGGEAAIHQPWRTAIALLDESVGTGDAPTTWLNTVGTSEVAHVRAIGRTDAFSPVTTSAGRLFDAAATFILGTAHSDYDGHPAMLLEAVADPSAAGCYPLALRDGPPLELDWRPLVRALLADHRNGATPGEMSMRFHRALATAIVAVAERRPELPVVISGGVFQNRLLTELVAEQVEASSQAWSLPGRIPPNDGGLAAGQLAIALAD